MRNLHYKLFSYRLNPKTVKQLKKIKKEKGLTYNLLFVDLLKNYKKHKPKKPKS